MKKTLTFLMLVLTLVINGKSQIISQYIETDSGTEPKGIEIWNNTSGTLDFSTNNLVIEKGTNGGTPSEDFTLDAGTLDAGDVIVIGTSNLQATTEGNGSVFYDKSFTFNGDDALVVKYGGTTTDVFGEPGVDPGSEWVGNGVSTKNQNISLLGGINSGDTDGWSDPSGRFETTSTTPSGANGDEGFGIAPVSGGNANPAITNIEHTPLAPTSSDAVTVTADITDSDGTIQTTELHWGTESGNLTNTIGMSTTRATYSTDSPIPAQADGTTVYYEVYAQDNDGGESTSTEMSYAVANASTTTIPYNNDFAAGFDDIYTISVAGQNVWTINDEFARGNGYNGDNPEEDWMIIPGINLDNYSNEVLTFETKYKYGSEDADNYLKLFYSNNYSGIGDPTSADWTELAYTQPTNADEWIGSGDIDLSAISGTSVYIGFKYYSTDDARRWDVDNITIEEVSNLSPEISNLEYTPQTVTSSDAVAVTADITDSDGTIQTAELHWGTESGNLTNTIGMSTTRASYSTDSPIPAQADGTTVYFEVYAQDNGGAETTSTEMSYTVTDPATATLPYLQPFDTDLGEMYTYSQVGDETWEWGSFEDDEYAEMSGYSGSAQENIDWLITPAFDFTSAQNLTLNFDEIINYGTGNIDDEQEVLVSTDYSGIGDPTTASWTELTVTGRSDGGSWDFFSVDEVDLSAYEGESSVHIAFRYTSTTGGAATWRPDNILIEEQTLNPSITVSTPNGGESWEQGSSQEITWTSSNLTGNVKIDLVSSETTTLAASTEDDGTFSWDIPNDQTIADDYLVRITSVDNETVSDVSDATFAITAPAIPGELVITEIMYNPPESGNDSLEFIEIYNFGDFAVNLNGYYFDAGVEFIFPDHILNAGDYVVVAINQTAFEDFFGTSAFEWTNGALSNGGEDIILMDSEGTEIDAVSYSDAAPWPENADGDGPSLTLCDPSSDNSLGENWIASTEFAGLNDEDMLVLAKPGAPCGTGNLAADFDALETELSVGGTATFIDLTSGGPQYWEWTFEGGTPETSNTQNPDNIVYNTAGTYDVTLTVYNENGMDIITKEDFITVYDAPQADFTSDVTTIAVDGEVMFEDASTGNPTSWEWTFEGGTPASYTGQTPPAVVYSAEGTYDVTLTVSNEHGETTELKEDYITVTLEPAANFEAAETTLLVGESTTFTDLSSGEPASWEWTFEGGDPATFSGQNPPAVTYDSEGTFDVTLVVSNDVGENTLVREDYIVVGYEPEADFEATPLTLLEGQSVSFTDMSNNNPESWSWTFNGGLPAASSAQNPVVTYNDFGVYDVTLEVTNEFGSDAETKIEYIIVNGVGIEQLSLEEEKLIVYPNPAIDIVNVLTLPDTEAQVRILSAMGKQILTKKISDEKTTLNVGNLPSGIYIVEMLDTTIGQRITKRLIVK